jgi:pimeloyl-ACP methyl ester carboxylesterase
MVRRAICVAAVAAAAAALAASAGAVRPGPHGDAFYTPPALHGGRPGKPIWVRRLTGPAVLSNAARNDLVLYRSVGVGNRPVAVSGTVAVPRGKPPKGGWPVISWGHATVGLADVCAPTRSDVLGGYERPLLRRWIDAGYAVVRSDYEGLGTPGGHPDLIGPSEARAMLDMVRAAKAIEPHLDLHRVALAGHSVGGHAVLWAAALAPSYAPELTIRGTVAFAPSSHLALQAAGLPTLTAPSRDLAAVAAVIVEGAQVAYPSLDVAGLLSPLGAALFPQAQVECLPTLAATSFANVAPADLFRPDADLTALIGRLAENDPEALSFHTPVRVEQGTADIVVFPALTDLLVQGYASRGLPVSYNRLDGVDHFGLVAAAADDAAAFLAGRLAH